MLGVLVALLCNYLIGTRSFVFRRGLGGLELFELQLVQPEVLSELVIHVLLVLQLILAGFVQPLHLLELGMYLCILGRGGRPGPHCRHPCYLAPSSREGTRDPILSSPYFIPAGETQNGPVPNGLKTQTLWSFLLGEVGKERGFLYELIFRFKIKDALSIMTPRD